MKCLGCGRDSAKEKYKKQGYVFFQCHYCGLLFVGYSQQNSGSTIYNYNQEYSIKRALGRRDLKNEIVENFKKRSVRRILNQIKKFQSCEVNASLRLLDVGCAEGYFLQVAKDNNYEIFGTEVSEFAAELARERLGESVFLGSLIEAGFPDNYFDIICLLDVIEHFRQPYQEMQEINRILKKGAILCIQTPNLSSFYSRILGSKWFQIKPPEHLLYFSKRSISILLKRSNFDVQIIKPAGIYVTARYLEHILAQTNYFLARIIGYFFKAIRSYDTIFYINSGHMLCIAVKK